MDTLVFFLEEDQLRTHLGIQYGLRFCRKQVPAKGLCLRAFPAMADGRSPGLRERIRTRHPLESRSEPPGPSLAGSAIRLFGWPCPPTSSACAALAHKGLRSSPSKCPTRPLGGRASAGRARSRHSGRPARGDRLHGNRALSEETYPDTPRLYPSDPAGAPNRRFHRLVQSRLEASPKPSPTSSKPRASTTCPSRSEAEMRASLDLFERCSREDHLMGAGAADVAVSLRSTRSSPSSGPSLFHTVLSRYLKIGDRYPRLAAWIARVDRRPRA
jgi:hypothetical protein